MRSLRVCVLMIWAQLGSCLHRYPMPMNLQQPLVHSRLISKRHPPAELLAAKRRKVSELKSTLEAAGVSTVGIVEKEELERLVDSLEASQAKPQASSSNDDIMILPIIYMMDAAYAELDGLRLLVDTGSAVSLVSASAGAQLGLPSRTEQPVVLRSSRDASIALPGFGVAAPQQQLPPGVDGILGINCMKQFAAAELDWEASCLRLHTCPWKDTTGSSGASVAIPLTMRRVSAGELPFVPTTFGARADESQRIVVEGLVDTGSPVTMVTPELADAASMLGSQKPNDDIMTTGVDGQPTRMRASRCDVIAMGAPSGIRVAHVDATVFVGVCPMMGAVGWQGTPAALLGLDVLRGGVQGGSPKCAAAGGPRKGRLVLDLKRGEMVVCEE